MHACTTFEMGMKGPSPLKKNLEKIGTKWQQKRRKYFTRAGLSLISLEPFCLRKLVLGFVCVASGTVVAIVLNDGDLFVHLRSHMRVCMLWCLGFSWSGIQENVVWPKFGGRGRPELLFTFRWGRMAEARQDLFSIVWGQGSRGSTMS